MKGNLNIKFEIFYFNFVSCKAILCLLWCVRKYIRNGLLLFKHDRIVLAYLNLTILPGELTNS